MRSDFEEFNLYIYYSLCGAILGLVIWCLMPMIEASREFGTFRICLARLTCLAVRRWYGIVP